MAKKITLADLNVRSVELAKSAKELGKEVHTHLMNIARHVFETKDTTPATRFLVAIQMVSKEGDKHSVLRDDAVKNWLETFGFCTWGKDKSDKPAFKLNSKMRDAVIASASETREHFANAARNPWNKLTPAKPYAIFDLDKAIAALIKRADEKAHEKGPNGETHKVDAEKLSRLQALAEELGVEVK